MVLWMDYWVLCHRLAVDAEEPGDLGDALKLWRMSAEYGDAAYKAARMRVDAVTLKQISKPVAEMYTRSTRMELGTVTVLPSGIRKLKDFNMVTVTARTKTAAKQTANIPASQVNIVSAPTRKNWKRGTGKRKDEPKKDESNQKRPAGAPQTAANAAPLTEVVATPPGTSEPISKRQSRYGWDR
jgi:hypothetical protein